jgi:hypothetical protein
LDAKEQPKLASDKQLNLIDSLLKKKVSEKWSFDTLYENLKNKIGAKNDIENWTVTEAKKAIDILQTKASA